MPQRLQTLLFAVSIFFFTNLTAQTVLVPGDIAILGINTDDLLSAQRWSFVVMRNISAGTTIRFTDASINADGSFYTSTSNEGHMTWTTQANIPGGRVFIVTNNNTTNGNASMTDLQGNNYLGVSGTVGGTTSAFGSSGDQLMVYQGPVGVSSTATFIYALTTSHSSQNAGEGQWVASGEVNQPSLSYAPPSLSSQFQAVLTNSANSSLTNASGVYGYDNMRYNGPLSGTMSTLLSSIRNPANWLGDDATPYVFTSVLGNFTVTDLLPIVLDNFTAKANGRLNELLWITSLEDNAKEFQVEKSKDGRSFKRVAVVLAKGRPSTYQYTDVELATQSFYRLLLVDRDGSSKYSPIVKVSTNANSQVPFAVYPNPANQSVIIQSPLQLGKLKLYSLEGALLESRNWKRGELLDLSHRKKGIYILELSNGTEHFQQQIIKQ